jgi:hypothetical protein
MTQPVWNTPAGDLGTFPSGKAISIQLSATPVLPATEIQSYQLLNGTFPNGCTLNSNGLISGTPIDTSTDITYKFTVRATDSNDNIRDRTFLFTIYGYVGAQFTVPSGQILNVIDSIFVNYQIQYNNPRIDNVVKVLVSGGTLPPGLYIDNLNRIRGYPLPPILGDNSPTSVIYTFSLQLFSNLGNDSVTYSIVVNNQQLTNARNTRIPAITNSKWVEYPLNPVDLNYSYYLDDTNTIPPVNAGEYFSFKILGYDFDFKPITYQFGKLPPGLTGDSNTGWITGIPIASPYTVTQYEFSVTVAKSSNISYISLPVTYNMIVTNKIVLSDITWQTPSNLGTLNNGDISELYITATSADNYSLVYKVSSGNLPPNITLNTVTGELVGRIPFEPNSTVTPIGTTTTFTFSITAYNPVFEILNSTQEFTLHVYQKYSVPLDNVYIKAFPNIQGKQIIKSLLSSDVFFPPQYIYRPDDINFGIATEVSFVHAYGLHSVNLSHYYNAVSKNHYTKQLVLGSLQTAIARDNTGQIIYEVVYSTIIEDSKGKNVDNKIIWPYEINLKNNSYTIDNTNVLIDSGNIQINQSPGTTKTFYPNSLSNMRQQLLDNIANNNSDQNLLPSWMTSQQLNGNTLGYTSAWVLCYALPGCSQYIQTMIQNYWYYSLNDIDFTVDRYLIDKSSSYNYNNNLSKGVWGELPGSVPTPNPMNTNDLTVFFPNKTISPNN